MKYLDEMDVEDVVEAVFQQVSSDWDWLGYDVDERIKYSLRKRLKEAIKERAEFLHDEYLDHVERELAEARSELKRLRTEGNPDKKLEREIEDRDRLIKRMLLDATDGREFATSEEDLAATDEFTLVLAYNDGYPSAEVLDDEELEQRDLSKI